MTSDAPEWPCNIEAEQAVLGAALIDDSTVVSLPRPEDFYRDAHQAIARAMQALAAAGESVDLITVTNQLRRDEAIEITGGPAYLDSLISLVQSTAHVESYSRIVAERAAERRMAEVCYKAYEALMQGKPIGRVHPRMMQVLGEMEMPGKRRGVTLSDALEALATDYDRGKKDERIFTGLGKLDQMLQGFRRRTIIFLGGRPGLGKSALMSQIAEHVAANYGSIAVFSQEMRADELSERIVAQQTGVAIRKLDSDTVRAVGAYTQQINAFEIFDWQMTRAEMAAKILSLKAKHPNLKAVLIDHAQLVARDADERRLDDAELMSRFCNTMRGVCQELDVVLIVLGQLTRFARQRPAGQGPEMTDFLGGSAIEMTADKALILWRDTDEQPDPDTSVPIDVLARVVKNRQGPEGDVRMSFTRATTTFADHDARAQGQRRPATPTKRSIGNKPDDEFDDVPF